MRLRNDIRIVYSEKLLQKFGCTLNDKRDWLTSIYLQNDLVFNPYQHLLLIRILYGSMGELTNWLISNRRQTYLLNVA